MRHVKHNLLENNFDVSALSRGFVFALIVATLSPWFSVDQSTALADSWPRFRGPGGDGVSLETGLLRDWPEAGPVEIWRRPFGDGFSGFAVVDEVFYTLFAEGGEEYLGSFRVDDADEIWRLPIGAAFRDEFGEGSRSTPTVVDNIVYALSARGRLIAAHAPNGKLLWQVDLYQERYGFHGPQWAAQGSTEPGLQLPNWGYSYSPLVEDDLIVLDTGHGGGESIIAFDRWTGEPAWSSLDGGIDYTSPAAFTLGDVRQILVVKAGEIVSLLPNGEVFWRYPWSPQVAQPVQLAPDLLFFSTVHGKVGSMALRIDTSTGSPETEVVWASSAMKNFWSSSVVYNGRIYGFDNATFRCLSAATGEACWARRGLGKGSLVAADGLLFVLSDQGTLTLVEATGEAYRQKGRVRVFDGGRTWTPPAISGGKLFLRGAGAIVCLDLLRDRRPGTTGITSAQ